MTMTTRHSLRIESLEQRDVPASFGVPWADPLHLTTSFAPDGTSLQSETSSLQSLLQTPTLNNGQQEILRALQTWIGVANINVGLVDDGGQAFGTGGAIQGDGRFGDIRIGALSMTSNKLAETQPYDAIAGTWAGDVLLNDQARFNTGGQGTGYDLYTVFLQEFGHALGLANSSDSTSVMYDVYQGIRAGLTAGDIVAIQGLYGERQHDSYDQQQRNESFSTARSLSVTTPLLQLPTAIGIGVRGDITNSSDVDFYKFTALKHGWTTITVNTQGISLLTAQLDVFNSLKQRLGGSVTVDPTQGTISYRLFAELGKTYYLRVAGAEGSAFGVGAYHLHVTPDGLQIALPDTSLNYLPELLPGLNNTFLTATDLGLNQVLTGSDRRYDFTATAAIDSHHDVDYFRFSVPGDLPDHQVMNITVWALNNSSIRPKVTVYDSLGKNLSAEVVVNEDGSYGVQLNGTWRAGAKYYAKVENAGPPATGRFFIGIDFNNNHSELTTVVADTELTAVNSTKTGYISITENQLMHFVLTNQADNDQGVALAVYDSEGTLVTTLTVFGNDTISRTAWLAQGTYRVEMTGIARNGKSFINTLFTLKIKGLSDSIDPYEADPNEPVRPSGTSGGTSTTTTNSPPAQSTTGTSSGSTSTAHNQPSAPMTTASKPSYNTWYWYQAPPASPAQTY